MDKPDDDHAPERGQSIGRFLVLDRLGAGGMGVVLAAYDPQLGRRVAIKLLRKASPGSEGRARLLREAQSMARLSHPNVLPVYDVGTTAGGEVFLAMELVPGSDLATWLKTKRSWREIVGVFVQAGEGLAAAHAAGIVHRDFKPGNVLIGDDGRVRVMDFGLAGFARTGTGILPADRLVTPSGDDETTVAPVSVPDYSLTDGFSTIPGSLVGTPLYMSPEQVEGGADERSDQFAFCVALFEALYGISPFGGETLHARLKEIRDGRIVTPPASAQVPAWLRRIVVRGLRARREDRYPSVSALLEELRQDPARAKRRAFYAAAAVVVPLAIAFVAYERAEGPRRQCRAEARDILSPVWNPARTNALATAFQAPGNPGGAKRWTHARAGLDRYVQSWTAAAIDVCEATVVRHEQTPVVREVRNLCLSQRLHDLDAQLTSFEKADAQLVIRSTAFVDRLPPVTRCMDLAAHVSPPADPAWRETAASVQSTIAKARAEHDAGRRLAALPLIREATAKAVTLAYAPIEAEAWTAHAQLASFSDEHEEAQRAAHLAAQAADLANDRKLRAMAFKHLARSLIDQRRDEDAALWIGYMRAAIGDAPQDVGTLESDLAGSWIAREEPGRSLEHLALALAAWEKAGVTDDRLGDAVNFRASALAQLGRREEAAAETRRALDLWIAALGPDHPSVATGWNNLGLIQLRDGHLDEAFSSLETAAKLLEQWLPDHVYTATTVGNIGSVLARKGKTAEAVEYCRRDLEMTLRAVPRTHPHVAVAYNNLASNLITLKRYDEARDNLRQALEIWIEAYGVEHSAVGMGYANFGRLEREAGNHAESIRWYEKALPILEKKLPANHAAFTKVYNGFGLTSLAAGNRAKARSLLERALANAAKNPDRADIALANFGLARAIGGGEGRKLASEARAIWAENAERWSKQISEVDAWLASP